MMQDECFCVTPDGKEGSSCQDMEWQKDNCLQAGKTYEWDRTGKYKGKKYFDSGG